MQPYTDQFIQKTKTIETSPYCQAQALAGLILAILSLLKMHKAVSTRRLGEGSECNLI